jgi:hypothetical protein
LKEARVGKRFLALTPYYKLGIQNVSDPRLYQAHHADITESLDLKAQFVANTPNEAAYLLVDRFYGMFDMTPDLIPFVKDEKGAKSIDVEQIKKL